MYLRLKKKTLSFFQFRGISGARFTQLTSTLRLYLLVVLRDWIVEAALISEDPWSGISNIYNIEGSVSFVLFSPPAPNKITLHYKNRVMGACKNRQNRSPPRS